MAATANTAPSAADPLKSNLCVDFAPKQVRYIKLGAAGARESAALAEGTLEWGTAIDPHELAAAGDWNAYGRTILPTA